MSIGFNPAKLAELRAALLKRRELEQTTPIIETPATKETKEQSADVGTVRTDSTILDKHNKPITLNSKQMEFVSLASSGQSCVLIGAAGTGKTTCQKAVVQSLINNGFLGSLDPLGHKHLTSRSPGIAIVAYTRRAVANIRKNVSTDMQSNCITIHKLLEYQPVYEEYTDPETYETKTKMSFQATRNAHNPLPPTIRTLIFEESSMIGLDLYKEVIDACPHNPQLIFLGDIQQLPPVFGPAILGFKLLELPVVELTEVYRQALESPIISLAHRILSGNPIPKEEFPKWKFQAQLTLHPWKKKISADDALNTAGMFFVSAEKAGAYDPEQDIILIPFNKSFGTDELNKIIANHLARKNGAETFEIIAGFNKYYLSPGDKVLYDKEDATIISIIPNPAYTGAKPQNHSTTLDYWGHNPNFKNDILSDDYNVDAFLAQTAATSGEDRVRQASHTIKLMMNDSEVEVTIDKAADLNSLLLGYCLTIHKAQGSEFRRVYLVTHQSHNTMLSRELLYTAVTRAREELYIICEDDHFVKGIKSQRVKGNTLAEKAEHFKGKLRGDEVIC